MTMIRRIRGMLFVAALTFTLSCASTVPPTLSPQGALLYRANQAVVAIGSVQHVSIELNKAQVCEPLPCHPMLSTANTRIVVDAATDALKTLKATPDGWKAVTDAALARIEGRLDAAGKTQLKTYIAAARAALGQL